MTENIIQKKLKNIAASRRGTKTAQSRRDAEVEEIVRLYADTWKQLAAYDEQKRDASSH